MSEDKLHTLPLSGPDMARLADGSPRPIDPASGKPLMTIEEANWHSHVSGMAARQQSDASDPAASALLSAGRVPADQPREIGGLKLWPMSIGHFLALEKVGSAYASENGGAMSMLDVALAALIFEQPEESWALLDQGASGKAELTARASKLAFRLTAPVLAEVNDFIAAEMAAFNGEATPEKKPPSDETPQPPPAESPAPAAPKDGQQD